VYGREVEAVEAAVLLDASLEYYFSVEVANTFDSKKNFLI